MEQAYGRVEIGNGLVRKGRMRLKSFLWLNIIYFGIYDK